MGDVSASPLQGRTIVLTAQRRVEEFAAAFRRRGADVRHAAVLSSVSHVDDGELLAATRRLIDDPPGVVVVTTGVGFRGCLEAADTAGMGAELRQTLSTARLLARGAKARGAIQGAGLQCAWVAASEQAAEIRALLEAEDAAGHGVRGQRVAVQHHGSGADGLDELVSGLGADVVSLVVYRWAAPPDPDAVDAALRAVAGREVDAVVFTAAPGAVEFLRRAGDLGIRDAVVQGFQDQVVAACVGPVTAAPLQDAGVPTLVPERFRSGSLVRELTAALATERPDHA